MESRFTEKYYGQKVIAGQLEDLQGFKHTLFNVANWRQVLEVHGRVRTDLANKRHWAQIKEIFICPLSAPFCQNLLEM